MRCAALERQVSRQVRNQEDAAWRKRKRASAQAVLDFAPKVANESGSKRGAPADPLFSAPRFPACAQGYWQTPAGRGHATD
jgi:hypothetical protein